MTFFITLPNRFPLFRLFSFERILIEPFTMSSGKGTRVGIVISIKKP